MIFASKALENPASIPMKHKTKIRFLMESPFGEWDARLVPGALGAPGDTEFLSAGFNSPSETKAETPDKGRCGATARPRKV